VILLPCRATSLRGVLLKVLVDDQLNAVETLLFRRARRPLLRTAGEQRTVEKRESAWPVTPRAA